MRPEGRWTEVRTQDQETTKGTLGQGGKISPLVYKNFI